MPNPPFVPKERRRVARKKTSGKFIPQVYPSEQEAVAAWSVRYRSKGVRKEYAAFIYCLRAGNTLQYYEGRTYTGMREHGLLRANAVIPFLLLYFFQSLAERIRRSASIAAYVHTHPKPPPGFTCRHHSAEDLFLLKLPRIKAVYVIPYENNEINLALRRQKQA
jgi:hypothetical protein